MLTTIFKCDRCSAESVGTDEIHLQMLAIFSGRNHHNLTQHYHDGKSLAADWCRRCRKKLDLLPDNASSKDVPAKDVPAPTLEDMIREIIHEEIAEVQS